MVLVEEPNIDEFILQVFEEQEDSFIFPLRTQKDAKSFVKALFNKGISYVTICEEIEEFEHNFKAWQKSLGRIGIGRRILQRINQPLQDVLDVEDNNYILITSSEATLESHLPGNSNDHQANSNGHHETTSRNVDKETSELNKKNQDSHRKEDLVSTELSDSGIPQGKENTQNTIEPVQSPPPTTKLSPQKTIMKNESEKKNELSRIKLSPVGSRRGGNPKGEEKKNESDFEAIMRRRHERTEQGISNGKFSLPNGNSGTRSLKDRQEDVQETAGTKKANGKIGSLLSRFENISNGDKRNNKTSNQVVDQQSAETSKDVEDNKSEEPSSVSTKIEECQQPEKTPSNLVNEDEKCVGNSQSNSNEQANTECKDLKDKKDIEEEAELKRYEKAEQETAKETEMEASIERDESSSDEEDKEEEAVSDEDKDVEMEENGNDDFEFVHANNTSKSDVRPDNLELWRPIHTTNGTEPKTDENRLHPVEEDYDDVAEEDDESVHVDSVHLIDNSRLDESLTLQTSPMTDIDYTMYDPAIDQNYNSDLDPDNEDQSPVMTKLVQKISTMRTTSRDGPAYVYIFSDSCSTTGSLETNRIRIGTSKYPSKRLRQAQVFNPDIWQITAVPVSKRITSLVEIDTSLSPYSLPGLRYWYDGPLDDILAIVGAVAARYPNRSVSIESPETNEESNC